MCLKQKGRSGSTCWWFGIHLPPARYPKPATDHARAAVDSTAGALVRRINTLLHYFGQVREDRVHNAQLVEAATTLNQRRR